MFVFRRTHFDRRLTECCDHEHIFGSGIDDLVNGIGWDLQG